MWLRVHWFTCPANSLVWLVVPGPASAMWVGKDHSCPLPGKVGLGPQPEAEGRDGDVVFCSTA